MPRGQYVRKAKFAEDYIQETGTERVLPASGEARISGHESKNAGYNPLKKVKKSRHEDGKIIRVEENPDPKTLEWLAYMNEQIDIVVSDSDDVNAEPVVQAQNNGETRFFQRGVTYNAERRFVQSLAGMRTRYTQRREIDDRGNQSIVNVPHHSMKYPFMVIRDSHPIGPDGKDWLKSLMDGTGQR